MAMKKTCKNTIYTLIVSIFICLLIINIYEYNKYKVLADFNKHENQIWMETKNFLAERVSVFTGNKNQIITKSNFYIPHVDIQKEKELREQIFSYRETIIKTGLVYNNPRITLEFIKQSINYGNQIKVEAKEQVLFKIVGQDIDTGFGNQHTFTYKKIEDKWKLVNDEIDGENSMISPIK